LNYYIIKLFEILYHKVEEFSIVLDRPISAHPYEAKFDPIIGLNPASNSTLIMWCGSIQ